MARIAIIGDATSVAGFRPLGLSTHVVVRPEQARDVWASVLAEQPAVVFVTEPVYEAIADLVEAGADHALPAITVVPAVGSAGGVGGAKLESAIVRALGTQLPGEEEDQA